MNKDLYQRMVEYAGAYTGGGAIITLIRAGRVASFTAGEIIQERECGKFDKKKTKAINKAVKAFCKAHDLALCAVYEIEK